MNPVIKYALAALLLLGSISNAHAYYVWGAGWTGQNYTPEEVCADHPTETYMSGYYQSATEYRCVSTFYYGRALASWVSGSCPTGTELDEHSNCVTPPPPQCEAGSDTFYVRWTFPELNAEGAQHSVIKQNGCLYDNTDIPECGRYSDGVTACKYEYTQSDNPATSGSGTEPEPQPYTDNESPEQSANNDTGQTTYTEDPPVTNPDGSTTQTTNETTTNTTGSGTQVWNDDDYIYVRDSTGTTTVYDRQKTTTTNTDASVDETVVTTKSTQTPTTSTTTINKNSGNVTTTNNNQSTTNTSTTTTNNYYDSNGNLTGSDSTTTGGSETQNEGDENKEGNCGAPGQPSCEVTLAGEDQLTDPNGVLGSKVNPVLDKMIGELGQVGSDDISSDLMDFNPIDMYEGGTCDPNMFSTTYHSEQFSPLEGFCSFYDAQVRPILAFFFYALTAFCIYMIYSATMRKT